MTASQPKPLRCAVYTRVSTDHGLDQDFNSLDAQREAARAYVASQAGEGWRLVRDGFDDGGYSGGSMERPGLAALIEAIRARRIDLVVVYKVDRLTRSLADFAKLVDLFDANAVSFVSVTQSFNTTTSMGRLTLNMLLSFAQFEREVTGERIRDKIAASKKRGIWVGGVVPLGYKVADRKLLVEEAEAATVRLVFERYLALGSLPALQAELRQRGIVSRRRTLTSGRKVGGIALTNGPLAHLLRNRVYVGEINHKEQSYAGEHEAILTMELFEAVQRRLTDNLNGTRQRRKATGALLMGRLFDDRGNRMSPSTANKGPLRYRYYVSTALVQGRSCEAGSIGRVAAAHVDAAIVAALRERVGAAADPSHRHTTVLDSTTVCGAAADGIIVDSTAGGGLAAGVRNAINTIDLADRTLDDHALIDAHLDRAVIGLAGIELTLHDGSSLSVPWSPKPANPRRALVNASGTEPERPMRPEARAVLLRSIASGRRWLDEIVRGTIASPAAIAARERCSTRHVERTIDLAFLAPDLVRAIAHGTLPRGITASVLADPPMAWAKQWRAIGIAAPGRGSKPRLCRPADLQR